jgi:hypothetical protein
MKKLVLYLLLLQAYCQIYGQSTPSLEPKSQMSANNSRVIPSVIILKNPSFEGTPRANILPPDWIDCGPRGETEPDTQPNPLYSVNKPAQHGRTYLGMVVRENNTWESIGQKLSHPLVKDSLYECKVYLARSEQYLSMSRVEDKIINYITPTVLRVWGGTSLCMTKELLFQTSVIKNFEWQEYSLKLNPKGANYQYLIFEAFYDTAKLEGYAGNLLIDNLSEIRLLNSRQ